jgi:F-box protein 9
MDPNEQPNTEAELESFRQKWRDEVTARTKGKAPVHPAKTGTSSSKPRPSKSNAPDASSSSQARQHDAEDDDEIEPHVYHDLGEKQHGRRLNESSVETAAALAASEGPSSALEHYEKAVEKESEGRLGDSLDLYRKAFRVSTALFQRQMLLLMTIARRQSRQDIQGKALSALLLQGPRKTSITHASPGPNNTQTSGLQLLQGLIHSP